jgi:hypothetical protein
VSAAHPWRNGRWRCFPGRCSRGRQVEAPAVLADLRRRLRDEYGLDPLPQIAEVEWAILRQRAPVGRPLWSHPRSGRVVDAALLGAGEVAVIITGPGIGPGPRDLVRRAERCEAAGAIVRARGRAPRPADGSGVVTIRPAEDAALA